MFNSMEKEKMTPKERVLTAFARQIPDRVPIDYSGNPGIDARLKEYMGLKIEEDEKLREILGVDFRCVLPPYEGERLHAEIPGMNVKD